MKNNKAKITICLTAFAFLLMSISVETVNKIREKALSYVAVLIRISPASSALEEKIQSLQLQNRLLKTELKRLKEILGKDLEKLIGLDSEAMPAKVIYRSPGTWDSSLWINLGQDANLHEDKEIIAKNSPVVAGTSIIGIVDYVGKKQSRVKLITGADLTPSVRAIRSYGKEVYPLAKGELQGSCRPLWRREQTVLKGTGFNCDFEDKEGPARDLRTGKPHSPFSKSPAIPIIKQGDLLVTTGLDGIFPAGLSVGRVSRVFPLKEGDYYYELEAKPIAENLDDLYIVQVLPPVQSD